MSCRHQHKYTGTVHDAELDTIQDIKELESGLPESENMNDLKIPITEINQSHF